MDVVAFIVHIFGAMLMYVTDVTIAATTDSANTTTTTTTASPDTGDGGGGGNPADTPTTTSQPVYTNFFDDPHNQATYIVLPVLILVYGGCATIYCVDKCRKSCKKRARRKRHEEMMGSREILNEEDEHVIQRPEINKQQNTFNNMAYEPDDYGRYNHQDEHKKRNIGNKLVYPESPIDSQDEPSGKAMLQRGSQKMGYNIMPLPNSTEDPVVNSHIDTHLKNAFAMIEHAARDIKMQQALEMRSCPDRFPKEKENDIPIPNKSGYKRKYYIAT